MKILALSLCLYLNVLTVLPSVKAINMTFFDSCAKSCSIMDNEMPNGCSGKEKCMLNFNFNSVTFLVFTNEYQLSNEFVGTKVKDKLQYQDNLKSHFNVSIWQPPETSLVS